MDRSQRSIHRAQMERTQQYMARRNRSATVSPQTVRRPDGIDLTVRTHTNDARREVAQRHREHNTTQARTASRMGAREQAPAPQRREQSRQATRTSEAQRER